MNLLKLEAIQQCDDETFFFVRLTFINHHAVVTNCCTSICYTSCLCRCITVYSLIGLKGSMKSHKLYRTLSKHSISDSSLVTLTVSSGFHEVNQLLYCSPGTAFSYTSLVPVIPVNFMESSLTITCSAKLIIPTIINL